MPKTERKIEVVLACGCEEMPPICASCEWEVLDRCGNTLTTHKRECWREAIDSAMTFARQHD